MKVYVVLMHYDGGDGNDDTKTLHIFSTNKLAHEYVARENRYINMLTVLEMEVEESVQFVLDMDEQEMKQEAEEMEGRRLVWAERKKAKENESTERAT